MAKFFLFIDRFRRQINEKIPGPVGPAASLTSFEDFWEALLPDNIFEIIVQHTNTQIENTVLDMIKDGFTLQSYHRITDLVEIKAYVGLLYYAGGWKSSNVDVHDLWDKANGLTTYICVMSRSRFTFLSTCLRFDDKSPRNQDDRFAPIREIFEMFIHNCQICYNMSEKVTVDEQLLSFRGRCKFRVYMKSKPDKYGLKIITLNDAKTSYLYNAIPYLGKGKFDDKLADESYPEFFLRKITLPIYDTNTTVTCDNWFTSIPGLERFLEQPYNLTITGTLRKNKREIPSQFKVASKTIPSTQFCFSDNITLLSHTPKKNKIVLLASTFSRFTEITNGKPNIILHYNKTKGGTDTFDQLCHSHTVTRRTNRWPMRYFYGMLDQAAVNARILLQCSLVNTGVSVKTRASECLKNLAFHLMKPLLEDRSQNPAIRSDVKMGIRCLLSRNAPTTVQNEEARPRLKKQARCQCCPRNKDRKTTMQCPVCLRAMCDEHRAYFCTECGGE